MLGGQVRDRVRVYGWIGGDNPKVLEDEVKKRKEQGFTAVKMNATGTHFQTIEKVEAHADAIQTLWVGLSPHLHWLRL